MPTRIMRLSEGTLVEIESREFDAELISGGIVERISPSLQNLGSLVSTTLEPLSKLIREASARAPELKSIELEFGIALEAEGNLFITRSRANANLSLRLVLGRPDSE
jgi:hypothetical protein